MKYALLLQNDAADVARWKELDEEAAREPRAAEIPKWIAVMERMEARGQRLSGLELDEPETAKVVRIVDGETVVTDGPYAETKELVGGLMTVECATSTKRSSSPRRSRSPQEDRWRSGRSTSDRAAFPGGVGSLRRRAGPGDGRPRPRGGRRAGGLHRGAQALGRPAAGESRGALRDRPDRAVDRLRRVRPLRKKTELLGRLEALAPQTRRTSTSTRSPTTGST